MPGMKLETIEKRLGAAKEGLEKVRKSGAPPDVRAARKRVKRLFRKRNLARKAAAKIAKGAAAE